jgi:hypothetical protein
MSNKREYVIAGALFKDGVKLYVQYVTNVSAKLESTDVGLW